MKNSELMKNGGEAIRRRRMDLGMTQHAMAMKVDCSPSAVGRWEAGEVEPAAKRRPAIAEALRVDSFSSLYYGAS
jgi:transcriptional regulator with XRE-family HTH domain